MTSSAGTVTSLGVKKPPSAAGYVSWSSNNGLLLLVAILGLCVVDCNTKGFKDSLKTPLAPPLHPPPLLLPPSSHRIARQTDDSSTVVEVKNVSGLLGRSARLPCDITPPSGHNPLLLVIWFKEPSPDPVYSFDVRGNGVEIGRHWNDGINLGARARFEENAKPFPLLWIEDLRESDQGTYRCRVDFKQAPTKNVKINLKVIVPPGRPIIHNERGILVEETTLGPYNEGAELMLTCTVSGGRPTPSLHWWINGVQAPEGLIVSQQPESLPSKVLSQTDLLRLQQQRFNSFHSGSNPFSSSSPSSSKSAAAATSTLLVGVVQRKDVDTTFTCLASNSNMTQASRATVNLQMNLLPLYVHITSERDALSAERVYDLHCTTFGSRPSALVTWWLGQNQLLDHSSEVADAGNVTSSTLRFKPKIEDQSKLLRCRAENPVMPASQIEDTWTLDVNYLPVVILQLGPTLRADSIKEGDDVYFECKIRAKPKAYKIEWKFNGVELRQDLRKGIIMTNGSLVLQSLSKSASGNYHCVATNSEGSSFSNPLELDIKYKPVCGEDQKTVYGVAHGEIASINCTVKANPTDLMFRWTFNSSSELNFLPRSRFTQMGTTSQLVYSLNTGRDYGTILCWAENELGAQMDPCVFHLIPADCPNRLD